jgi:hypothetical protein
MAARCYTTAATSVDALARILPLPISLERRTHNGTRRRVVGELQSAHLLPPGVIARKFLLVLTATYAGKTFTRMSKIGSCMDADLLLFADIEGKNKGDTFEAFKKLRVQLPDARMVPLGVFVSSGVRQGLTVFSVPPPPPTTLITPLRRRRQPSKQRVITAQQRRLLQLAIELVGVELPHVDPTPLRTLANFHMTGLCDGNTVPTPSMVLRCMGFTRRPFMVVTATEKENHF